MTEAMLRSNLKKVVVLIFGLMAFSLLEFLAKGGKENTFFGYHGTLIGLLIAAYVAYCFQQRSKFIDDLRKWWFEMVSAKSSFLLYLDKTKKEEDDYLLAYYKLSTAMDTLRLIYCNIDRSPSNPRGYYPFEQIRDIVDLALYSSPERFESEDPRAIKDSIIEIFQSLRHSIQDEAHLIIPENPMTFEGSERNSYIERIRRKFGVDVSKIRAANKTKN